MMLKFLRCFSVFFFLGLAQMSYAQKVHSHNDYLQSRPFWEAYESGASSIEADVWLQNGELYVAHELSNIDTKRSFEALYLKPLLEVHNKLDRKLQLLIDVKSEAIVSLATLVALLQKYPELHNSEIQFVISGNRPKPLFYSEYPAYIFFDYQSIDDIPKDLSKVALISLPFYRFNSWNGVGKLQDEEELIQIVAKAHELQRPIRFWATPDTELAWQKLAKLGIDFINTDKPRKCVLYFKKD